jgi:FkbM family methyltransferase
VSGRFRVENQSTWIEGDLGSFLERELYLYGEYENLLIEKFLNLAAKTDQRTVLDIGANIGQHSMNFSGAFDQVHSFEPNPKLWHKFENNMSLNKSSNVTLHQCGLANEDAEIPFYNIGNGNEGLGTFSDIEQYDQSLEMIGKLKVVRGDEFLRTINVGQVDAMKIDVQGFEGEVLLGLQGTIRATHPVVWLELGAATKMDLSTFDKVQGFFPYPIRIFQFEHNLRLMICRIVFKEFENGELPIGDYVVCPRD